jgi:hypothetical protein
MRHLPSPVAASRPLVPEHAKTFSVSQQNGLGLDEEDRAAPCRCEPCEKHEGQSVHPIQLRSRDLSAGNLKLFAQQGVIADQLVPGADVVEGIAKGRVAWTAPANGESNP